MTAISQAITQALFHFLWQGALLALLLSGLLLLCKRSTPVVRYAVSCGAMVLLALLPIVTVWYVYEPYTATVLGGVVAAEDIPPGLTPGFAAAAPAGSWLRTVQQWALTFWAAGVLLFSLRLAWGAGQLSVMRREGMPAPEALRSVVAQLSERIGVRYVRVLTSTIAEVPSAIGWLRPAILLPAAAITGLTPQQLQAVLAHELAHIRRHDYLVNILQMVVETLLFYHPAVWWVSSVIRHERELCCDDLAVRSCGDALCYARALTALEKLRLPNPRLAMGSTGGSLLYRIQRIVEKEAREQGPSRVAGALGLLVLGVFSLAFTLHAAREQPAPLPGMEAAPAPVLEPFEPLGSNPEMTAPLVGVFAQQRPVQTPSPSTAPTAPTAPNRRESVWVLFRGERIAAVNGSSADEAEAKVARQKTPGGDLLWFRLEGRAYVTQDPAILSRIGKTVELPQSERELAAYLEALATRQQQAVDRAETQRAVRAELEALTQQIETRSLSETTHIAELQDRLQAVLAEVEQLRERLDAARRVTRDTVVSQRLREAAQALEESGRLEAERERQGQPDTFFLLEEAVKSGTAKPVQ